MSKLRSYFNIILVYLFSLFKKWVERSAKKMGCESRESIKAKLPRENFKMVPFKVDFKSEL